MQNIVQQFETANRTGAIHSLKIGHINDSYIVESQKSHGKSYFLQKINHHIFKNVSGLQQNIQIVTNHLRKKLIEEGETDIDRKVLQLIPTKDGKLFYQDKEGDFWRLYVNIKDTHSFDLISPDLAFKTGEAFGNFHFFLSDISQDDLIETIPNFHNMEFRLEELREAVQTNAVGRVDEVQWLIYEIEIRGNEMCMPERLFRDGKLKKRINHCDTKVNNMLFNDNDDPICIVDLDTVMPGFVLSDFGDFMRTAGNTGKEDDTDLDNVSFNMEIFKAYTRGYLKKTKHFLDPIEIELLPFGAKLLTYMQFCRFLTDFLNGDTYYKINYPLHNLDRSKAQFKLLQSIETNYTEMQDFITTTID